MSCVSRAVWRGYVLSSARSVVVGGVGWIERVIGSEEALVGVGLRLRSLGAGVGGMGFGGAALAGYGRGASGSVETCL
jgi:hypothetical protein